MCGYQRLLKVPRHSQSPTIDLQQIDERIEQLDQPQTSSTGAFTATARRADHERPGRMDALPVHGQTG